MEHEKSYDEINKPREKLTGDKFASKEKCPCGKNRCEKKLIDGYTVGVCSCGEIRFTFQNYDKTWHPINKWHPIFFNYIKVGEKVNGK